MVISIILSILKIIGIILLCILGLVLLFVLLMLFVPIRYKVYADGNVNDTEKEGLIKAWFSWTLIYISGKYSYPSEEGLVIKVGPFKVFDSKEEEKPKKEKKTEKKKVKETKEDISEAKEETITETDKAETVSEPVTEDVSKENEKESKKTLKEKILYTWQNIYDKINGIYIKIKDILAHIHEYMDIIQSKEFKAVFELCKKSFLRMIKMVKPRKLKIKGTIGMKSPDQTGYLCAAIGVISPYFRKQIQINPDFENFIIKGSILVKGRMYMIVFLIIAMKAFFDKNIRKLIDMFRKEEGINE